MHPKSLNQQGTSVSKLMFRFKNKDLVGVASDPDLLLPYSQKRNFMSNPQDIYTALVHDL